MTIMILNINNNNITFDEKSYRAYAVADYAVHSHPVTPELILTLRTRIYIYIHVMNIILLPSIQCMSCEQNKRPNVRRQPLDSIVFDVFEKRYVLHCTLIIINI